MPYHPVGDIIETIRGIHRRIQRFYAASSRWQDDERLGFLLERMARQERAMAAAIAAFEVELPASVRETWLQYVPFEKVTNVLDEVEQNPESDVEEVARQATALDAALIEAYRLMGSTYAPPRVREVFASLVEMEDNKGKQRSVGAGELYDDAELDDAR